MPRRRLTLHSQRSTQTETSFVASASCAVIRTSSVRLLSKARTRSVCKTRPSSVSKPPWRSPTTTDTASNCSSPRSGYTKTKNRLRRASISSRKRYVSRSVVLAAHSGAAKTSACRCIVVCSLSSPDDQSKCSTAVRSRSSDTFTGIQQPSSCATMPIETAPCAELNQDSCSTAVPTHRHLPQYSSMP